MPCGAESAPNAIAPATAYATGGKKKKKKKEHDEAFKLMGLIK